MINWIVTASALIVVLTALRYLLRGKISLRLQYALWAIVLLRLLVPVQLGHTDFSVLNTVEENEELQITVSRPMFYVGETPDLAIPEVEPDPTLTQQEVTQLQQQLEQQYYDEMAQYATPVSLSTVLRAIWITGIAVTAVWLLVSNLRFGQMLRRSRRDTGLTCGKLTVYVSPLVDTPCLFGLLRPAVYVTENVLDNDTVLRHVLSHEGTHYRHGDHIWSALRGVCLALHWYNPLVWLAAALSRRDAELACDEGTLRRLGEEQRTAYGQTLIALTCAKRRGQLLLTATTMTGSKKSLRERIKLIAKRPKMAVYTLVAALLVVAIAAGCTFTGERKPAEPEFAFLELPDTPVDAQVLSAVKTYIIAHADILSDLAGSGAVTGAYIHSIAPSPTGKTENGLGLYEVVYYLQCNDPRSAILLQELCESAEFAEKWQTEGTNGNAPVLTNPIHSGFQAQVLAPYIPGSQAPVNDGPSTAFLGHLSADEQLGAALSRLSALQPEDVGDLTDSHAKRLGADTLISLIHRAVEHQIEIAEPPAHALWAVSFGLGEKPKNSTLRMEHISLSASAEENILEITYQSLDNVSVTFYAEDSEAYWTIRNTYQSSDGPVDEEAMVPYLHLIEAEAQEWIDRSVSWPQPLNGYEIVTFRPEDSFHHEGADYAVYRFEVAFLTDDPMGAGWAGGMSLDSQGRIRNLLKVNRIVTRTVNGKTDAMIGAFDLPWFDRQYVIGAFAKMDNPQTDTQTQTIRVVCSEAYGEAVARAAEEWVISRADQINALSPLVALVDAGDIFDLTHVDTTSVSESVQVQSFSFDYRLRLRVQDAIGMQLDTMIYTESGGWYLVERNSADNPVLVMEYRQNDDTWTYVGAISPRIVYTQYGGDYTAAAMDIYQSAGYTAN